MDHKMDISIKGTPLTGLEYTKKLAVRLWDDALVWATMWPLLFSILYLWKDQFFVLENGWIIWAVTFSIALMHMAVLAWSGASITLNLIAAHANPNGGSNRDGSLNTMTSQDADVFLSGFQFRMTQVARLTLICFLAYVPLQALSDAMVDSLKMKLLTDCLIAKIEAVENQLPPKVCKRLE